MHIKCSGTKPRIDRLIANDVTTVSTNDLSGTIHEHALFRVGRTSGEKRHPQSQPDIENKSFKGDGHGNYVHDLLLNGVVSTGFNRRHRGCAIPLGSGRRGHNKGDALANR